MQITKINMLENGPIILEHDNGDKLAICRCGCTNNSPFCDGSHKGILVAHQAVFTYEECCSDGCRCNVSE
jgi:CDGSH-type Zn-finger protein